MYICTISYLSIHLSMNVHPDCLHMLTVVNDTAVGGGGVVKQRSHEDMISILKAHSDCHVES